MSAKNIPQDILNWLLDSDVSIQYQVHRDLLDQDRPDLQARIAQEGWGAQFLSKQNPNGHWGRGFYQVKWISTHYTLLDLRSLEIAPGQPQIDRAIQLILQNHISDDGGVNPAGSIKESDVCINGMFLRYACFFQTPQEQLHSIIDFILGMTLEDGGFNCQSNRHKVKHSSVHSTLSILEGIEEYRRNEYTYRLDELLKAAAASREFLLQHHLYRSDRTGEIINKKFLMLSYPSRWFYNILRALDYFQFADIPYDVRMQDAIVELMKKRRNNGTWPVQARHAGETHFEMEQTGKPSRWNTLIALRVLRRYPEAAQVL